jgi:hypothetical protein
MLDARSDEHTRQLSLRTVSYSAKVEASSASVYVRSMVRAYRTSDSAKLKAQLFPKDQNASDDDIKFSLSKDEQPRASVEARSGQSHSERGRDCASHRLFVEGLQCVFFDNSSNQSAVGER